MNTRKKVPELEGGSAVAEQSERRELLKDILGRPKWWLIVAPLIALFLVAVSLLIPNESDASPRPTAAAPAAPAAKKICTRGEYHCYPADWFVEEFKDGKYGTAHGIRFPLKLKRMLNNALRARAAAGDPAARRLLRRGDPEWWQEALGFTACIAGPRFAGTCRKGQERVNEIAADTSRVTLVCGISAFIGSLRGGGYWGAGRGAALCFWHQMMPKLW